MEAGDSPKTRLDMEHGFMQSIIKNQVERDEYDKEQKLLRVQGKSREGAKRTKRAAREVYVPPHLRTKAASASVVSRPTENSSQKENSQLRERTSSWGSDTKDNHKSVTLPAAENATSKILQLKLEFERQDGQICELCIHEGEDLRNLVAAFGRANGLDQRLRDALYHRLSSAMKGRAA